MRSPRRTVGLVVAVAALGGCGGGGSDSTTSTTTVDTTTTTTTTTATTATTVTTTTTAEPGTLRVQVFFLDQDAFNVGRPPYVLPVERTVPAGNPERGALDALFEGPTPEEGNAGLRFVASGATGIADLRITDGTAHVQLAGGCSSGGSTFTIAEEIGATLRQFEGILTVKIYDPDGTTEFPDDPGDSIPECLEP